jgi:hypothetical protein
VNASPTTTPTTTAVPALPPQEAPQAREQQAVTRSEPTVRFNLPTATSNVVPEQAQQSIQSTAETTTSVADTTDHLPAQTATTTTAAEPAQQGMNVGNEWRENGELSIGPPFHHFHSCLYGLLT